MRYGYAARLYNALKSKAYLDAFGSSGAVGSSDAVGSSGAVGLTATFLRYGDDTMCWLTASNPIVTSQTDVEIAQFRHGIQYRQLKLDASHALILDVAGAATALPTSRL